MGLQSKFRALLPQSVKDMRAVYRDTRPLHPRSCPLCGYHGYFKTFGSPPRIDARCSQCGSLERHRLLWNWFTSNRDQLVEPVVHFAPEPVLEDKFRKAFADYKTADLFAAADLTLNIEAIDLPDASVGTVVCNHVLEHVDDRKALAELRRIIDPGGTLIVTVPLIEGWSNTYEPEPPIVDLSSRLIHFGQHDHVRYFGRDLRDRIHAAGFPEINEATAEGAAVITFGLIRGEKAFICR